MAVNPLPIILDTDFDTDCDDVGALAVLHALANRGNVRIAGIVSSVPVPSCVPCIRAINSRFGRETIPVAGVRISDWEKNPAYLPYRRHREACLDAGRIYNDRIAATYLAGMADSPAEILDRETTDAVELYRCLLSKEDDGSTTICAIGTLTALSQLLRSSADEISPLTGYELVARKVSRLVTMAIADFPTGEDRFNWRMDLLSASDVVRHWPRPICVSALGGDVLTGEKFVEAAPADHPAALAYRIWFGEAIPSRPSWDQVAVMYAAGADLSLFEEQSGCGLDLDPCTGKHTWQVDLPGGDRSYLSLKVSAAEMAEVVEERMIEAF